MAIFPYVLAETNFPDARGPNARDNETGSSYAFPVVYNVTIPTGSVDRTFAKGNVSVTVIDPNGEGTCKPRLVATGSFSFQVLNDNNATPGLPFDSNLAILNDIYNMLEFFGGITYPIPAGAPLVP